MQDPFTAETRSTQRIRRGKRRNRGMEEKKKERKK
jgi:hypothetical protein